VTPPGARSEWDYDHQVANANQGLFAQYPYVSLIMAAILLGDPANKRKMINAFPDVAADLEARGVPLPRPAARMTPTTAQRLLEDIELAMDGPSPALIPRVVLELRLRYPEAWAALTTGDQAS